MKNSKLIAGTIATGLTLSVALSVFAGVVSVDAGNEKSLKNYSKESAKTNITFSSVERNILSTSEPQLTEIVFNPEQLTDYINEYNNSDDENETEEMNNEEASNSSDADNKVKKDKKKKTKKKKNKNKKKKNTAKELIGTYKVTAYCSCSRCCGKSTGITASGTRAKAGRTVAADTSRLPFGTKLEINGHTYTVEDRGGAINGNKIDVYFNSHQEALGWGVKYIKVYKVK
jgi:3D (Asp-Asp-Asp) domain-containing protein